MVGSGWVRFDLLAGKVVRRGISGLDMVMAGTNSIPGCAEGDGNDLGMECAGITGVWCDEG
jgi:hypothetical protein